MSLITRDLQSTRPSTSLGSPKFSGSLRSSLDALAVGTKAAGPGWCGLGVGEPLQAAWEAGNSLKSEQPGAEAGLGLETPPGGGGEGGSLHEVSISSP